MPNTSGTGICDEDHTESDGRGHSDHSGLPHSALLHRHILLLRRRRYLVPGVAPDRPAPWSYDPQWPKTDSEALDW